MERRPSKIRIIFGSGPAGLAASIVLFVIAFWLTGQISLPPLSDNRNLLNSIFAAASLLTLAIIVWSVRSLSPADRGRNLSTSGAFRFVRHPLYAAFLSVFNFGLAIWLNSYIMIIWAVLLHPLWHYIVRDEETMMIDLFGEEYRKYQKRTGRFLPKVTGL
jgi:protein-S-isoprenylcysteine O-methyltransferase Ste14